MMTGILAIKARKIGSAAWDPASRPGHHRRCIYPADTGVSFTGGVGRPGSVETTAVNHSTAHSGCWNAAGYEGHDLAEALHARMCWNTPLSLQHADLLMDRLDLRPGLRIADVGCGWGELLLQVVARGTGPDPAVGGGEGRVLGIGVDTDDAALDERGTLPASVALTVRLSSPRLMRRPGRGRGPGAERRFLARVRRHRGRADGAGKNGSPRRPSAVGTPTGRHALPGGDGNLRRPDPAAAATAGGMPGCGWRVDPHEHRRPAGMGRLRVHVPGGGQEWLITHGDDSRSAEVRDWLDGREREYVHVYRGVLGFTYLVLAH